MTKFYVGEFVRSVKPYDLSTGKIFYYVLEVGERDVRVKPSGGGFDHWKSKRFLRKAEKDTRNDE
jgi:hypothetical protein